MSAVPPHVFAEFQSLGVHRLDKLSRCILYLEGRPEDQGVEQELLREAHTLKGEANMLGLDALGALMHRVEDLLLAARAGGFRDKGLLDLALMGLDAVQQLMTGDLRAPPSAEALAERDAYLARLEAALGRESGAGAPPAASGAPRSPAEAACLAALPALRAALQVLDADPGHAESAARLPAELGRLKALAEAEGDAALSLHLWSLESEALEAVSDEAMMFGDLGLVGAGLGVLEAALAPGLAPEARAAQLAAFNEKIGFTPGQDLCSLAKAAADEPNDVPDEILDGFQASSLLRIDNLSRCLLHLEETPGDEAVADELLRDAHTLKGDARLVGLMDLGFLIHRFEDLLLDARKGRFQRRSHIDMGLHGVDLIHRVLSSELRAELPPALGADIGQYLKAIDAALSGQAAAPQPAAAQPSAAPPPAARPAAPAPKGEAPAPKGEAPPEAKAEEGKKREEGKRREFLHVPLDTVEQLLHLSGELTLWQTQQDRVVADIRRLVQDWRSSTQRFREEGRLDAEVAEKFGALSRELAVRVQQMRDDGFQNALRLTELQDSVGGMQLVEVRTVFGKYPRAVRAMVRDLGKECAVELEGVEVAVDKTVLMQIEDALLHLVRNSLDHGIEMPDVRAARGKPARGTLRLSARNKGSFVEVEIADDGGGIDAKKISARLVSKGILSAEAAAAMGEEEMLTQIFRPGFSTAETVTDISGRGVGMDVVKRQIDAMGGSVRIFTKVGQGTRFVLSLPVSASVAQAMVFRQDQGLYAMPSAMIESMLHVMPSAVQRIGEQRLLRYEGELISLHDLAGVLGFPQRRAEEAFWRVVVLRAGDRRLAVRVGSVLGERKLVQQASDAFLSGLSLLSGTARIEGGELVSVLNVGQLIRRAEEGLSHGGLSVTEAPTVRAEAAAEAARAAAPAAGPATVLVVEDSDMTRRMLVGAVGRLGYRAIEAVNGRDGLEKFKAARPDLLLTDLDMPVMGGVALIEALRGQGEGCPMVVMTSRESEESKAEALRAGASAYLLKSAFTDAKLGAALGMLLGRPAESAA